MVVFVTKKKKEEILRYCLVDLPDKTNQTIKGGAFILSV